MAASTTKTLNPSTISFSIIIIFTLLLAAAAAIGESAMFIAELYHRDSPRSPFRDLSLATQSDRLLAAANRSVSRATDIAASGNNNIQSRVTPDNFEYLMKLYFGTPPVERLAIADTGSDLTWIQCEPCDSCYKQRAPLFVPDASSSYLSIPCSGGEACELLPERATCGEHGECEFVYGYGDGSWTAGYLATETLSFDVDATAKKTKTKEKVVSVPEVVFGCVHGSGGKFEEESAGLVGLGAGKLSLVTQISPTIHGRFSYCLVPFADAESSSIIFFGDDTSGSGGEVPTTPIFRGSVSTFYNLNLESIVVSGADDHPVPVPASTGGSGNIIIDSGTTLTILPRSVLDPLEELLSSRITKLGGRVSVPGGIFGLCYRADYSSIVVAGGDIVPVIKMKFEGDGAWVELQPVNTFVPVGDGVVCLAMVAVKEGGGGIAILGNVAQMNFHVGYDTAAMKLSFSPADCAAAAAAVKG